MNQPYGACQLRYGLCLRRPTSRRSSQGLQPSQSHCLALSTHTSNHAIPVHEEEQNGPHKDQNAGADKINFAVDNLTDDSDPQTHMQEVLNLDNPYPFFREDHQTASQTYGYGGSILDNFDNDPFASARARKPYYPFADKSDWEMALWLLTSGLSMEKLNEFFHLHRVGHFCLLLPII